MSIKQRTFAFEFFSFAVIFLAAFGVWVVMESLVLVAPEVNAIERTSISRDESTQPAKLDNTVETLVAQQEKLQAVVDNFATTQNGTYGIYVKNLDTGVSASHNADASLSSASLYKLYAAQIAYTNIDNGLWYPGQMMDSERGYDLEKCLEVMITVSDNECGRAILIRSGISSINDSAMTELGYSETDLSGTYTKSSASDVGLLLEDIYYAKNISESSSQSFLDLLAAQKINDRLPQGLPDGVQIMHKTGDLAGYVHDAGIVRSIDGNYIIVVMSGPDKSIPTYAQRYSPFAEISKTVYETMTGN